MKRAPALQKFVDEFATEAFGRSVTEAEQDEICVICGKEVDPEHDFRDRLSIKEYWISGMCQGCQDDTFGEE